MSRSFSVKPRVASKPISFTSPSSRFSLGSIFFVSMTTFARFLLGFIAALCLWLTLVTSPWAIITGIIAIDRAKRSPSTD